jgi:hypothetical protein
MKRNLLIALVFVCAVMLSGCHIDGKLYPVQGPLASQASQQIFAIRFTGGLSKSGEMSATLANGELCKGTWAQISDKPTKGSSAPDSSVAPPNLASAWDAVYGQGFYAATVLGQHIRIRGTMNGNHGTTLTVEAYSDNVSVRTGVAVDNQGNVYKLAF